MVQYYYTVVQLYSDSTGTTGTEQLKIINYNRAQSLPTYIYNVVSDKTSL